MKRAGKPVCRLFVSAAAILCAAAALLSSCSGGETAATDTAEASQTEASPSGIGLDGYAVIRPMKATGRETDVAVSVRKALEDEGLSVTISDDWVKDVSSLPAVAKEILVGNTNRPETAGISSGLKAGCAAVRAFPSGRIAIYGSDDASLDRACAFFISTFVTGKGKDAAVTAGFEWAEGSQFPISSLKIGGTDMPSFSLVIPDRATRDERCAAEIIESAVKEASGFIMKTYSEKNAPDGAKIYIGNCSAAQAAGAAAPDGGYLVRAAGGGIYVSGSGGMAEAGANALLSEILPAGAAGDVSYDFSGDIAGTYAQPELPGLEGLGDMPVALTDQKNAVAAVYDILPALSGGRPVLKYTFDPSSCGFSTDRTYGTSIDECRLRYSGTLGTYVIGFTSSAGFIGLAEYPSGKKIWETSLAGFGPHCIEYLPNGTVAVALSGNGDETRASVRLYAAPSGGKSSGYDYDMLTGAHSVLWDDVRQLLWVLGSSELRAYRVSGTVRDPKLTRITSAGASGKWGGHDLSAIHGEPDLLLISGAGAFVCSKTSGTVSDALPKSWGVSVSSTKCLCSAVYGVPAATGASRLLLLTQATKVFKDHDTDRFSWFIMPDGDLTSAAMKSGTVIFDGPAFYKARAWTPDYCRLD